MIKSMTAYSKQLFSINNCYYELEIKCLNSKFFESKVKLPNELKDKELEVKKLLQEKLQRGKVDFYLHLLDNEKDEYSLNEKKIANYITEIKEIANNNNIPSEILLSNLFKLPNIVKQNKTEPIDDNWNVFKENTEKAIKKTNLFREKEGKSLEKDIRSNISVIKQYLDKIKTEEKQRTDNIKSRIEKKLSKIENLDKNRLEQEVVYYIEKLDINEEIVRLDAHIEHFICTIQNKTPIGKKLGFLTQEIGRETNTIGAKANNYNIQKLIVEIKSETEKIKEQISNVL